MSFSENLCKLQSGRGESNYKLAKAIGASQSSIQNWKDGKTVPHRLYVKSLAEHYGVTVDELLGKDE